MPNSKFTIEEHGILVRLSQLDGAVQRYVQRILCSRFQYLSQYSALSEHPGGKMYYATGRDFYWPHISNNIYGTLGDYRSCARDRQADIFQRKICLFPPNEALGLYQSIFLVFCLE